MRARIYFTKAVFEHMEECRKSGEPCFSSGESIYTEDLKDWRKDDVVFISAQEHREILAYVKRETIKNFLLSLENAALIANGLPIEKIREYEIDFQGIPVLPGQTHTEEHPT